MSEPMLELRGVGASYGAIQALHDVSLKVERGAIVALLGSNGAGKSTTLNVVSHLIEPSAGEIFFDGEPIRRCPSDEIVRRGLVQVPEGREVFKDMSVRENLELGAFLRRSRGEVAQDFERVFEIFPRLKERSEQKASTLSGGEQQMLAIGRALMARPRMILLDEPSMGLSPLLVEQIFETIQRLNREQGLTILVVEQDVRLALRVARYAYILENGEMRLEGPSDQLMNDPAVRRAYLGV
ncbi:MAG: ABC transporter ATP-binding protein [Burkholderiaceae bacterium]|nr:ABC transporter ATP-binding protein [Pseudomonadota bacterium]MBS0597058.1 ABC transporter ATP-binding protein [Pseudomonadota bacterium]MCO5114846.1 ABC transporter ATP-binding protein [Burkholderiaceae bacterium]MCP5218763.1 ABC transporter ATP-binding protein [Burkholderiaceae bacterium]